MPTDIVHHLYPHGPAADLVPYCGQCPGRDPLTGDWHTGHSQDELLKVLGFGLTYCSTCLSPEALGGWTPLVPDPEH